MRNKLRMIQPACFILVPTFRSWHGSSAGFPLNLSPHTISTADQVSEVCRSSMISDSVLKRNWSRLVQPSARAAKDVTAIQNSLPSLCLSSLHICSTWLWLHLWTLSKARNTHESAKLNWKSPEKRITQENFSISCFQLGWNQHKNSYNSIWLWHAGSQPKGRKFRGM